MEDDNAYRRIGLFQAKLELKDGRAGFQFPLAMLEDTNEWPQVEVAVGGGIFI